MADYPKYMILDSSQVTRVDGYIPVRASNGSLKVRKMMSGEKTEFTVEHFLFKTDWDTLESFYQTNKTLNVNLYWPGYASPFVVKFIAAPARTETLGRMFRVQCKLAEA